MSNVAIYTKYPKIIKKILRSSYHDEYDNSLHTFDNINCSLSFASKYNIDDFMKHHINYFDNKVNKYNTNINFIIKNTDILFISDLLDLNFLKDDYDSFYEDDYPISFTFDIPIIMKLNRNINNIYCVLKNISLDIDCKSCDGRTTCSFNIIYCLNIQDVIYHGLTNREREYYNIDEKDIENINKLTDIDIINKITNKNNYYEDNTEDNTTIKTCGCPRFINYLLKINHINNNLINILNKKSLTDIEILFK
jgi:hypothetical protein